MSAAISSGYAADEETLQRGMGVYMDYCSLCHGMDGMGEGGLPLKIKPYPTTNLLVPTWARTTAELADVIANGTSNHDINRYMPPFGSQLSARQVDDTAAFIWALRKDTKHMLGKILVYRETRTAVSGKDIFTARCVLCHGKEGLGNGRMARVVKSPPPANLVASKMPEAYLQTIVFKGGEAVGRSAQMPPWEGQLSHFEVEAVVRYIMGLRLD